MVFGIGTDSVLLEELERSIEEQPVEYLTRIFTPAEISYADSTANRNETLAGRLAAKEAFMKALQTGWTGEVDWLDIEIKNLESGAPFLSVSGSTESFCTRCGVKHIHVSITHTAFIASAVVILEA